MRLCTCPDEQIHPPESVRVSARKGRNLRPNELKHTPKQTTLSAQERAGIRLGCPLRLRREEIGEMKEKITNPRFLYWLTVGLLMLPNLALCLTEDLPLLGIPANILLPLGFYMWWMTFSARPGKMIWASFPLVFFAAFQLVLLYLYGQGIISVDMFLNVVTSNSGEITELLGNLIPAVAGVFVLYLPLLVLGALSIASRPATVNPLRRLRLPACVLMLWGALFTGMAMRVHRHFRLLDNLYPVNVCYNLGLAVERSWVSAHYRQTSAGFSFNARPTHPADSAEVYVMVIGETARAQNFGIYGYGRNTTPGLSQMPGVVSFGKAVTQSNTTHKSVPMLLSAATADCYSRLYREKGILAAFREAGFRTAFFSNQLPNHSFIDFLGAQADTCVFVKEMVKGSPAYDADLLPMVSRLLEEGSRKVFVVLHTYGSHFDYRERYPRTAAHFLPDDKAEARYENRKCLLNAYDNTIRYTDSLLTSLCRMMERHGGLCAMLYTSDHGENIFDDERRLFLHASPSASEYELRVPLVIWQSEAHRRQFPDITQALRSNDCEQVQTSVSAFHTMLMLGGISTPVCDSTASVADFFYIPQQLYYLNDHNRPVKMPDWLEDALGIGKTGLPLPGSTTPCFTPTSRPQM